MFWLHVQLFVSWIVSVILAAMKITSPVLLLKLQVWQLKITSQQGQLLSKKESTKVHEF